MTTLTKQTTKRAAPTDVLESIWLTEVRLGTSVRTIAKREGLSRQRIQHGVTRARLRELGRANRLARRARDLHAGDADDFDVLDAASIPTLVPLFPVGPLTPSSECCHHGPIRPGSNFCCMICHASGIDDHPALQRDPKTDPAPEPKPSPTAKSAKSRSSRNGGRR